MGALEVALLVLAQQVTQAVQVFCQQAGSLTIDPIGKLAYDKGKQLASNLNKLAGYGLAAASPEFTAVNVAEKAFVGSGHATADHLRDPWTMAVTPEQLARLWTTFLALEQVKVAAIQAEAKTTATLTVATTDSDAARARLNAAIIQDEAGQ